MCTSMQNKIARYQKTWHYWILEFHELKTFTNVFINLKLSLARFLSRDLKEW